MLRPRVLMTGGGLARLSTGAGGSQAAAAARMKRQIVLSTVRAVGRVKSPAALAAEKSGSMRVRSREERILETLRVTADPALVRQVRGVAGCLRAARLRPYSWGCTLP